MCVAYSVASVFKSSDLQASAYLKYSNIMPENLYHILILSNLELHSKFKSLRMTSNPLWPQVHEIVAHFLWMQLGMPLAKISKRILYASFIIYKVNVLKPCRATMYNPQKLNAQQEFLGKYASNASGMVCVHPLQCSNIKS